MSTGLERIACIFALSIAGCSSSDSPAAAPSGAGGSGGSGGAGQDASEAAAGSGGAGGAPVVDAGHEPEAGPMCAHIDGTDSCILCAMPKCCVEIGACQKDSTCKTALDTFLQCRGIADASGCTQPFASSGTAQAAAAAACMTSNCASDCD
jgi:hypothetical protein